jgi:hypothetical protein
LQLRGWRRYLSVIGRGDTDTGGKPERRGRNEQKGPQGLNNQRPEMIMKTVILTTTLVASILASALTAHAADRRMSFDGAKFFAEIERQAAGQ